MIHDASLLTNVFGERVTVAFKQGGGVACAALFFEPENMDGPDGVRFTDADLIAQIPVASVADLKNGDRINRDGVDYRVGYAMNDGAGMWTCSLTKRG